MNYLVSIIIICLVVILLSIQIYRIYKQFHVNIPKPFDRKHLKWCAGNYGIRVRWYWSKKHIRKVINESISRGYQ